jgi:transketolase
MPCWKLFDAQSKEYKDSVLPPAVKARLAIEAAAPLGWQRYVGDGGDVLGVETFGASAPGEEVMQRYGFSVENVLQKALALLESKGGRDS